MAISVDTPDVEVWYSGPLDGLQLTVSVCQTNRTGPSKQMWCGHMSVSSRPAMRTTGVPQSNFCCCILCSVVRKGWAFYFCQLIFTFTRNVPSHKVDVGSSLRLEIGIIFLLFLITHPKNHTNPPPPPKLAQQIQEKYCPFFCQGYYVM
jgi:hypothetical protein